MRKNTHTNVCSHAPNSESKQKDRSKISLLQSAVPGDATMKKMGRVNPGRFSYTRKIFPKFLQKRNNEFL